MRVLLDAVVASDRRYFELGAEAEPLPGATLLHLPGSSGIGAGTVVWVDHEPTLAASPGWVARAAEAAIRRGAPSLRVYGLDDAGPGAAVCASAGLVARDELAFVGPGRTGRSASALDLRPADGDEGALARRRVGRFETSAPDGHPIEPEAYLAGEERRAATGELDLHVAWDGDEPVAIVGCLRLGTLLRLKNLLVRPDRRREGIGTAVTATLLRWAGQEGRTLGVVAVAGETGERIYRSLGMPLAGTFTEWSVPLPVGGRPAPEALEAAG